jgi:hypothetical protein
MIFRNFIRAAPITLLILAGCASVEKPKEAPVAAAPPAGTQDQTENIDLEGLERSLNLSRPQEELGYQEAGFNTCSAGFGFSSSINCRKMVMAVVHVRLQCRDSEGTISTALGASDLVAIAGQGLRWTMQRRDGITTTDGEGYAEVRGVFSKTPRNDWLRLAVGLQFLNVRANQVTRVVTPRPWCHPD